MCYVRSCTGVAYHVIFVFNVMQPPPAIKLCNLEAPEDKLRLSKLSLGEAKGSRLMCGNPSPKYASLGWFFLVSRWSVVKLGINICFSLLSRCRCLLGCCCEAITCFFLYGHSWTVIRGGKKNLKESIRH